MPFGRGAPLNRQSRRLVEDDDRVVAVQDRCLQQCLVCRPRLGPQGPGLQRHFVARRHADRLTRVDAVTGPRPLAVDADPSCAEQLFELTVTETVVVAFEPAVEAK